MRLLFRGRGCALFLFLFSAAHKMEFGLHPFDPVEEAAVLRFDQLDSPLSLFAPKRNGCQARPWVVLPSFLPLGVGLNGWETSNACLDRCLLFSRNFRNHSLTINSLHHPDSQQIPSLKFRSQKKFRSGLNQTGSQQQRSDPTRIGSRGIPRSDPVRIGSTQNLVWQKW